MNIKQTINSFSAWTVDRLTGARRATLTTLATFLIAMTAQAWTGSTFSGGTGTADDPYQIKTADDLKKLSIDVAQNDGHNTSAYYDKFFKVMNDIDFGATTAWNSNESEENNFTPINASGNNYNWPFAGTFDGGGHTISGIRIYKEEGSYLGLFGEISPAATVKNVILADMRITGKQYCGGIAGQSQGIIENCHVTSTVEIHLIKKDDNDNMSAYSIGGIAGCISGSGSGGHLSGCTSAVTISHTSNIDRWNLGGIVGYAQAPVENNFVIGATIPAVTGYHISNEYGAIVGKLIVSDGASLKNNYYTNCTVAGTANATDVGCYNADVTEANGAVSDVLWGLSDGTDGSQANPYIIKTTGGLAYLAQKVNGGTSYEGKYFKLGADITYTPTSQWNDDNSTENNFTPIGLGVGTDKQFKGHFDGDNKTISGIRINSNNDYQGLFGFGDEPYVTEIKNIKLANTRIVGKNKVGGIVGKNVKYAITNCHIASDVTIIATEYECGGIAGSDGGSNSSIIGCTSAATVNGIVFVGGIAGNVSGSITDCFVTGATVSGTSRVGAITGFKNNGTLKNNYYTNSTVTIEGSAATDAGCNGADEAGARKAVKISAAEGVTITPTGEKTTYNASGITTYDDADYHILGYDSKLYAGATEAVKLSIGYTVPEGYKFIKINAGEKVTVTASGDDYAMTLASDVTGDVTVDVDFEAIKYTLKYEGVDEAVFEKANPTEYTIESETFKLNNPSKEDYVFTGWTYGGQTTPTTSVTIATGSTGDKTFTANWRSLEEPNTAVVDKETAVAIDGEVFYEPNEEIKEKIEKTIEVPVALSAEASNRMEVTPEGSVKFSQGPSFTVTVPELKRGAKMRLTFIGQIKVKNTEVRRNSIYTRGRGDSSSDGMIDLVSGVEYEVLKDGPLVLTIVLEEEEAVLEGISVTESEPSDGSIVVTAKNKYWTFSSDKDVKVPAGVKVYTCQLNSDQTAVVITNITSTLGGVIKAGNGVLLSSAPGDYVFAPSTETASETKTYENNLLEPVLKATNFASGEYYVLKDNEFHPILANDSNVPANKAVLRVAKKSAARLEIIGDDDVKTAINGIAVEEDGAEWYTISGQRIDKPTKKGLYIKNGKKVIIK